MAQQANEDMPLADYISARRVVALEARDREGVLRELAAKALAGHPGVTVDEVATALEAREVELSTCITEGLALPHTAVSGLTRVEVAVGFSADGVEWASGAALVRVVVMVLAPASSSQEHIRLLGVLGRTLQQPDIRHRLRTARTPHEIALILAAGESRALLPGTPLIARTNRLVTEQALHLGTVLGASALMLYADRYVDLGFIAGLSPPPIRLLLASPHLYQHRSVHARFAGLLDVPATGMAGEQRLEFMLLMAMSEDLIASRDRMVCVWGRAGTGRLDSISAVDVAERFHLMLSLKSELSAGDVNHFVLNRLLSLAACLGREGREGKPVGAMFVIGRTDEIAAHCRQLVINPFKGYTEDQRNVLDPRLEETIKEFSVIDGAFVIRGDGVLMSAGTHLSAPVGEIDLPPGLGARHAAAAAITAATSAVAIVVSESTGTVSFYARGQAVMVLPREDGHPIR